MGMLADKQADFERHARRQAEINEAVARLQSFAEARMQVGADITATEYIVDGFIPEGQVLICGAPGAGKTNAVVSLAVAATGAVPLTTLDFHEPRHVIYLTEDPRQVAEIAQGAIKHLGADKEILKQRFHIFALSAVFEGGFRVVGEYAELLINPQADEIPPLIVLDTVSAAGALENENDNGQISALLARLKVEFKDFPHWLIHHTAKFDWNKAEGDFTARGGGAFEANVQAIFGVYIDEFGNRIMQASPRKRRDQGDIDQLIIESEIHTARVVTRSGREQLKKYIVARPRSYDPDERERAAEVASSIANGPVKDRISGWFYSQRKNDESTAHLHCWEWCKAESLGITQIRCRELLNEVKAENGRVSV